MFFSFEGIDGSGKSTQARLLAEALRKRGYEVVEVREPGGTTLGERIRALLLDPDTEITPRAELLSFLAARAQVVDTVIAPALERGVVVIADRFTDSSVAYQGGGRGMGGAGLSVSELNAFATGGVRTARTYLVDLDPVLAVARRGARRTSDRMETGGDAFYDRVRQAYLDLSRRDPGRVVVLDGTQAVEALHAVIVEDALRVLSQTKGAPSLIE